MDETVLIKAFRRLSQGSRQSVQSGNELDDFDKYIIEYFYDGISLSSGEKA